MYAPIKFHNVNTSFSKALKEKINLYFSQKAYLKEGNSKLFLKAGVLISTLVLMYVVLVFVQPVWYVSLLLCVFFGFNLAAIGFNIMHDAGHDTFSSNKTVNRIFSYSLNLLGGNIFLWKLKHNIAHHTFTNIDGADHDIEIKFMRVHPDQPLEKIHKYQRFYFIFLYSISYLAWIFYQDYEKFFMQRLSKDSKKFVLPVREKVIFWLSKALHGLLFIVIPIIFLGPMKALIGILVASLVCGLTLATIFQLAHVVEDTEFNTVLNNKVDDEWMVHQIRSTSNFATRSKVLTWFLGGLNYQVEHHLFPRISHIHYPQLNSIVKETCKEFGLKYNEHKTLFCAFKSHFQVIGMMSKQV